MTEMMDPFDFVAWHPGCSSTTTLELSRWQKQTKRSRYDAYYHCFRILYDIIVCLVLCNMVYLVLQQLVQL